MFGFIFRIARRAATVKRSRFLGLTFTMAAASALLVLLSALYFNAESQLKLDLTGVPNMVVEPGSNLVAEDQLFPGDVETLKSKQHFWRNNVNTAAPFLKSGALLNGKPVKIAGSWFKHHIRIGNEAYTLGLLTFSGWSYSGKPPDENSVIAGANIKTGESVDLEIGGKVRTFKVAGRLETGSYWDDYLFLDLDRLGSLLNRKSIDEILVSALIKPKDKLATSVEQYGEDALTSEEYEKWYCSPYTSSIAYTIQEVLPQSKVRVLRRVTEVQEGIIKASGGVFLALFVLTLVAAITAIFSAEKMYITSHFKDFGIMAAIGGSRRKIFLQIVVELSLAALLSGVLAYGISAIFLNLVSNAVFQFDFHAQGMLMVISFVIPFATMLLALLFVRRGFSRDVGKLLRSS